MLLNSGLTWCGPCIAAMPHISALQDKHSDDNVQIISVSDEDIDTVTNFLERPVAGRLRRQNLWRSHQQLLSDS